MLRSVNKAYWLTHPKAVIVARAVYSCNDNDIVLVCPCNSTISMLTSSKWDDYYLANIWENGVND